MTPIETIKSTIKEHLNSALFCMETPPPTFRGKVRDIYDLKERLLIITSDRVSAFDRVLGSVPLKGALLCEQAYWWFNQLKHICPTHFIERPDPQAFIVKKATPLKVEVIVRGFLAGSLMRQEKSTRGQEYGLTIDPSMKDYERFDEPILTPTTKGEVGEKDCALTPDQIISSGLLSSTQWQQVAEYALALFKFGSKKMQEHGLYLVDTKYEFGVLGDDIILIDEIHTSDSSRFFVIDDYKKKIVHNSTPMMLDKEFLRQNILSTLGTHTAEQLEDYKLSDDVRTELAARYWYLTEQITGLDFIAPPVGAAERLRDWFKKIKS
ncbi:MAG: hypothetical protein KC505_11015 [Myxococcales bacterium]|nr:hypothetical protein [Myxococcales bacterium]USN50547.1 MAG: phosphoribosylaminoimidazolesuccinocarboxamide synthase [Myxococcales bacterium]